MAAYATAALIRSMHNAFKSTAPDDEQFGDTQLTDWAEDHCDPKINARLAAAGFTTPITSDIPDQIRNISAKMAAAHGLKYHTGATFSEVDLAAKMWEEALVDLEAIAEGSEDVGLTRSTTGGPISVDDDPDTYGEDMSVVGSEDMWNERDEVRE